MKRILFLIHTLGGGGAEKVLINLVNNLDHTKYDITVMTVIDVGELRYQLNENIKYKTTIKLRGKKQKIDNNQSGSLLGKGSKCKTFLAKIYAKIWKYMPTKLFYKLWIKEKYDVEISFLEGICAKVISSSSNKNSKKYAWIHVDLINQKKSSGVFKNIEEEKRIYNQFDRIVCVSKVVREQFINKYSFDPSKVIVKYNSIDKEEIIKKSREKCQDFKKDKTSFLLGSVGRLNKQKSYDRLLRIVKRLIDENYNIKLIIIGEGTKKQELENYIHKNHLEERITLLGFRSNPYQYIKNIDLFVCSSIAEGFSTVISEAIILDIPIVTTNCSGMKEMLGDDNEYGIVTKNDEEALYQGIKRLLDDQKLYHYYKQKIKQRKSMFDLQNIVSKVEELLGE